jgi:hypothetical protein
MFSYVKANHYFFAVEFPMLQFDGLASSTSLAAMSVVTTESNAEDLPQDTEDNVMYVRRLEGFVRETLEQNNILWSKLVDNISATQQTIPRELFVRIYPVGKVLIRRIIAMTQHLVLQDHSFCRRPGVKPSDQMVTTITRYANEAVMRVTRGHAVNGPVDQHEHGKSDYIHI